MAIGTESAHTKMSMARLCVKAIGKMMISSQFLNEISSQISSYQSQKSIPDLNFLQHG